MALSCGKKRSTLLRRIMSKYHGKLYCLNYQIEKYIKINIAVEF